MSSDEATSESTSVCCPEKNWRILDDGARNHRDQGFVGFMLKIKKYMLFIFYAYLDTYLLHIQNQINHSQKYVLFDLLET